MSKLIAPTEDNPKGTAYDDVRTSHNIFGSEAKRVKQFTLSLRFSYTTTMTDALEQIATTDKAELSDFINETKKNVKVYEGMKEELANNPTLANQLADPNLTPQEKQQMLQTIANTVKESLGYETKKDDVKLVSTNKEGAEGEQFKGHYSQDDTTYINDKNNKDTEDLLTTVGHETQHNIDDQENIHKSKDKDQNTYATNFGEDLADYTDAALDIVADRDLADSNNHNNGQVTDSPSIFNDSTLANNNEEFGKVDVTNGDDFIFGQRPLDGTEQGLNEKWQKKIPLYGKYADEINLELNHEHGFFEDGTGDSVGFFDNEVRYQNTTDKEKDNDNINQQETLDRYYQFENKQYDDDIMRKAIENLKDNEGKYNICTNNCQDYSDKLRIEYDNILKGN